MQFKQFYLGCLAQASYFISSEGEAVVVDPQRDVDQYLDEANEQGVRIRYILETHLHADFVSGHRELAGRTGAEIVFGAAAGVEFPHLSVYDGDELRVGSVVLRAIETPGHTPESISWLVSEADAEEEPVRLLTGDTLFIGDVGRPDLAGARGHTSEEMASMLYDSLRERILTLDDAVEVWPAHGAGSACGRNISQDRSSTVGAQRLMNYALAPMSRAAFVSLMTTDLPPAPRYFAMDAEINRRGARSLVELSPIPLSASEVRDEMEHGAIALDVRSSTAFGEGHIPSSLNIGLDGQYASWAGTLVESDERLIVVADSRARSEEAVMRLARVGLENVVAFLEGGFDAWRQAGLPVEDLPQISVGELQTRLGELAVLDVRRTPEHLSGHVPGSMNVPLADLPESIATLSVAKPIAVICAGGYRSMIAASLLRRKGQNVRYNVTGGTSAWIAAGYETER